MKSPIIWFGGKGLLSTKIVNFLPPHRTYVEPFGGGASVLFEKEPSSVEVYNDIDPGLVDFFTVLQDEVAMERLVKSLRLTPYSREEFEACRNRMATEDDIVERVRMWYVVVRQSYSGTIDGGWRYGISVNKAKEWRQVIDNRLRAAAMRIKDVVIENMDWREVIAKYDAPDTLFYCDPPYVHSTRGTNRYKHELSDEDHKELVNVLLGIRGKCVLSGYDNDIYSPLDRAHWKRLEIVTVAHSSSQTRRSGYGDNGSGRRRRKEVLWLSESRTWQMELFPADAKEAME